MRRTGTLFAVLMCWVFCLVAAAGMAWAQDTQDDGGCDLRTLASLGPTTNDDRASFQTTADRFRVSYEVDFEDDDPNNFRDFTVEINDRFGLVESDSTDQDAQASFIVPEDPGTFEVSAEVEPNNGATYTVTVEECSSSQGGTPPAGETPREGTPPGDDPHEGTSPVQDQYAKKAPPGDVSNPKDVVPGSDVGKKIPVTGGPPLVLGALVLLGAALIAGRGVLRR